MNDICMVSPTLDKEKGSLEKQIETIERLTRTLNLSIENTQMFIFSDPNSGSVVCKEEHLASNSLEGRLDDLASELEKIVSKSNLINDILRDKLGTMTL